MERMINGVAVVGTEEALTGIGKKLHKAHWLVLADGSRVAGCTFEGCEFTAPTPASVLAHYVQKHGQYTPKSWGKLADLTVRELMDAAVLRGAAYDKLIAERDEARALARKRLLEIRALEAKLERRERRIDEAAVGRDDRISELLDQVADANKARMAAEDREQKVQDELDGIKNTFKSLGLVINGGQ